MQDLQTRALALVKLQTPCSHGVEQSAYLKRGALLVCPLCRFIVDDKAWHGVADNAAHAPRDLPAPVSAARREALAREAREALKRREAREQSERKAITRKRREALAGMTPAAREASEREHAREADNARVAREARRARASMAPRGTVSHREQAPSSEPSDTRVDSASERRTRDALPDSLWHGVGWHGDVTAIVARYALRANGDDVREARLALARAISDAPTVSGAGTAGNIRNRRNRARKALRRASAAGAPVSEARDALAARLAGVAVFTVSGIDTSNASEARLSARQQAPARRHNAAPASAASDAPTDAPLAQALARREALGVSAGNAGK